LEVVKAKLRWPQSRFMWSERDTHGGDQHRWSVGTGDWG
jgi:hypothetical protein